jgi:hypothetical protein
VVVGEAAVEAVVAGCLAGSGACSIKKRQGFTEPRSSIIFKTETVIQMNKIYHHYPPATDPAEIRIVSFCNSRGLAINRIQHLINSPELMTTEIAEYLVSEFPNFVDANMKASAIHACSLPQFHDLIIDELVALAKADLSGQPLHEQRLIEGTVSNCIINTAQKQDASKIGEILLGQTLDTYRSMLVPLYAKLARPNAKPILFKCVNDPVLKAQALKALSILGETSIEAELVALSRHEKSGYREIARAALKRVEKNKLKMKAKAAEKS